MELTYLAEWLNTTFAVFDNSILALMHRLALLAGVILTPLFHLISFLGENGIAMFLLGLILMCFARTRKTGICIFGAVCCGALITNIVLKDIVARPRPFQDLTREFSQWWNYLGSPAESGYSFPSGHVTAITAGMTALFLSLRNRRRTLCLIPVLLMGISRIYLMAHYPSDVLAAVLVGLFSGVTARVIGERIYFILRKYRHIYLFELILRFDLSSLRKGRNPLPNKE